MRKGNENMEGYAAIMASDHGGIASIFKRTKNEICDAVMNWQRVRGFRVMQANLFDWNTVESKCLHDMELKGVLRTFLEDDRWDVVNLFVDTECGRKQVLIRTIY